LKKQSRRISSRRKAREIALEALYRVELANDNIEAILKDILSRSKLKLDARNYAKRLTKETTAHLPEIDKIIKEVAENWEFSRIAIIDKNILRFAICEILYFDDIPPKVSLDEAIEIAKKYSTQNSGRFVNGVLDKVIKVHNLI
jgi:transcription antitermination factor NusB